jgi:hypothetical protein
MASCRFMYGRFSILTELGFYEVMGILDKPTYPDSTGGGLYKMTLSTTIFNSREGYVVRGRSRCAPCNTVQDLQTVLRSNSVIPSSHCTEISVYGWITTTL